MSHRATSRFWLCYRQLSTETQVLADRSYQLLLENPHHPSLRLKKVGDYWSVRVGLHFRALAVESDGGLVWVWIGTHEEYIRLIAGV